MMLFCYATETHGVENDDVTRQRYIFLHGFFHISPFFLKFPGLASYHLLRFFVLLFDRNEKEQGTSMKQERTKNKHETRKKN